MTAAENLEFAQDFAPSSIVTAVFVRGASPASSGWVVGDVTAGRREDFISDTNIATLDDLIKAGQAVLSPKGSAAGRGTLDVSNYSAPNPPARSGSKLIISDANMGWTSKTFLMSQIDKTFDLTNHTQSWSVTFFDPGDSPVSGRASAIRTIRAVG